MQTLVKPLKELRLTDEELFIGALFIIFADCKLSLSFFEENQAPFQTFQM